jgi:sugar phosphate isomerase/epimerase
MFTRREFGKLTLAALAVPRVTGAPRLRSGQAASDSTVGGVRLGVQTYSFRELPRTGDDVGWLVKAVTAAGLTEVELFAPHIEPRSAFGARRLPPDSPEAKKARDDVRTWRLQTPLDHFRSVKKAFNDAGVTIYAYNYSFNRSMTDQEIDRGFEMARALGAEIITASTTLDVAKRVVPFADRHKMVVAMHNHSNLTDPNEFATPASFAAARNMSKQFKVNLDIGHFTAANFDAVSYIRENHDAITNLHLKDRKKDQGDNTPWGEGDTPIREVLQLLKKEKWPIRAYIEYEYKGAGAPLEEVKKCLAYAKKSLG